MFRVGQRVVCVAEFDQADVAAKLGVIIPVKGSIYTVREFVENPVDGEVGLRVREIDNKVMVHSCGMLAEPAFAARCFRPLQSTETGMAVLRGLLKTRETV